MYPHLRISLGIYGKYFEDENLQINHTDVGFVAMANMGPDTNGCQFYINTLRTPWLDGRHTIFGKVLGYSQRIVHMIEKVDTYIDAGVALYWQTERFCCTASDTHTYNGPFKNLINRKWCTFAQYVIAVIS